jgi:desulfoferrodoxin (superoxide reductase-like protein)
VELRINDLYIGRAEFSAKIMDPVVEFIVNFPLDDHGEAGNFQVNYKDAHTVCARARCNVHGLWEAKADFVK